MASQTIQVICPNLKCRSILNTPIGARGKTIRCGQCGFRVKVPGPKSDRPQQSDRPAASATE